MERTYKMIGADGKEYGPATISDLQSWVGEGRIGRTTLIWSDEQQLWLSANDLSFLDFSSQPAGKDVPLVPRAEGEPASFWSRLGGLLIDLNVVNLFCSLVFTLPTESELRKMDQAEAMKQLLTAPWFQGMLLTIIFYTVVLHAVLGATPGKFATGTRVVTLDGERIGFAKSLLRFLGAILNFFSFGAGYALAAFRSDRRGLHDLIAGTKVIYHR
jgi:uncharacterized RDD family membrane protein YckC